MSHAPQPESLAPNRACLSSAKQQAVVCGILATIAAHFEVVRRARIRRRGVELQLRPRARDGEAQVQHGAPVDNMMYLDVSKPEGMDELKEKA